MVSRIIIKGTIAILIQREAVARKIQARFRDRGMEATILKEDHPKIVEFLERGQGLLITDTYFGFRPIRKLKDANNMQVAVCFVRRPNDSFDEKTLQGFGHFVVGVFEEEMEEEHLDELIKLAVTYESDVDPAITLGEE